MIRVGLTGGIASGKSEVARRLAVLGAVVIDADVLAREVVAAGTDGLAAVVDAFGPAVLTPDGGLDRARLGAVVFADPDARRRLEAIIHPLVRARAAELQAAAVAADPNAVVVHDIPLLVESGQADDFDLVVVVDAPDDVRTDRLMRIRGMSADDARARIGAQVGRAERNAAADVVIDNDGDLSALHRSVDEVWSRLTKSS